MEKIHVPKVVDEVVASFTDYGFVNDILGPVLGVLILLCIGVYSYLYYLKRKRKQFVDSQQALVVVEKPSDAVEREESLQSMLVVLADLMDQKESKFDELQHHVEVVEEYLLNHPNEDRPVMLDVAIGCIKTTLATREHARLMDRLKALLSSEPVDVQQLKKAVTDFEEFLMANTSFDRPDEIDKAKFLIKKHAQFLEHHEKLKSQMDAETIDITKLEQETNDFEQFLQTADETLSRPAIVDEALAMIARIRKEEQLKAEDIEFRNKLSSLLGADNVDDVELESVTNEYEQFLVSNPFLSPSGLVDQARETINKLRNEKLAKAKDSDFQEILKSLLNSETPDVARLVSATLEYEQFLETNTFLPKPDVLQEAHMRIEHLKCEQQAVVEDSEFQQTLKSIMQMENVDIKKLERSVTEYEEFLKANKSIVPGAVLAEAREMMKRMKSEDLAKRAELKEELRQAMDKPDFDLQNLETAYEVFTKYLDSKEESEYPFILEEARVRIEMEKARLVEKDEFFRKKLEEAMSSGNTETLASTIEDYTTFLETNAFVEKPVSLLKKAQLALEEMKQAEEQENSNFQRQIEEAMAAEETDIQQLQTLINNYEAFVEQHSYLPNILDKARKFFETQKELIDARYNELSERLVALMADDVLDDEQADATISELEDFLSKHGHLSRPTVLDDAKAKLEQTRQAREIEAKRLAKCVQCEMEKKEPEAKELSLALKNYDDFLRANKMEVTALLHEAEELLGKLEASTVDDQLQSYLVEELRKENPDLEKLQEAADAYDTFLQQHTYIRRPSLSLVDEARELFNLISTKEELKQALKTGIKKDLQKAVDNCRMKGLDMKLQPEATRARDMLEALVKIDKYKGSLLSMDRSVMMEIRQYKNPPPAIKDVMVAALLLLGDPESTTKSWEMCQKLFNSVRTPEYPGLFNRLKSFEINDVDPGIAARVLELLKPHPEHEVHEHSVGACYFYQWARGTSEQIVMRQDKKPTPARDNHIQKKILAKHFVKSNTNISKPH